MSLHLPLWATRQGRRTLRAEEAIRREFGGGWGESNAALVQDWGGVDGIRSVAERTLNSNLPGARDSAARILRATERI